MAGLAKFDNTRGNLLEEGCKSYLDARLALREFQAEVQKGCSRAMAARLSDLSRAMGVKLKEDDIESYLHPKNPAEWGTYACLEPA